jgi:hypothetical protein
LPLSKVQNRIVQLENALADSRLRSRDGKGHYDLPTMIHQLLAVATDAVQIEKRAVARGDDGTALAAIREVCRIAELIARIRGKLDESSQTNILNVTIDPETAKRIAEIYVKRNTIPDLEAQ